jgi:hypothetical protein
VSYTKPREINANFTNITDFVLNERSISFSSTRIGYDAGLGFDFVLGENRQKTTKKILFLKGGTNRPIGGEKFKDGGARYDPKIKSGEWAIMLGLKFGNKV